MHLVTVYWENQYVRIHSGIDKHSCDINTLAQISYRIFIVSIFWGWTGTVLVLHGAPIIDLNIMKYHEILGLVYRIRRNIGENNIWRNTA